MMKITVCIATYNGADVVEEQLQSIIPQLSSRDEIIVSDDGSTDGTREKVAALHCPLIRIVEGPRRKSPIPNFENALKQATGDVIFLSDQDDKWQPGKVKTMLAALKRYDCVVSDCIVTDERMTVTSDSFYTLNGTRRDRWFNLLCKNGYLGCCMAFRRKVLERALPFPANIPMHDIWIGNVAAFFYTIGFVDDRLILFRRHDHNASMTARKSTNPIGRKLMFRINVVLPLLKLKFKGNKC